MAVEWTLLRSKVARRLLLLFVAGALLPIAVLTLVALERVSQELHQQSRIRLQRASKASALFAMGRLLELEQQLVIMGESLPAGELPDLADERFGGFSLSGFEGGLLEATTGFPKLESLSEAERAHLRSGKTLLRSVDDPKSGPRVLLTRRVAGQGAELLLTGEVRLDHLLELSQDNALPAGAEFCALDQRGRPLRCSEGGEASLPGLESWRDGVSGGFAWQRAEGDYVARYWSLFLEPNFGAPKWIFVVAESRAAVVAPVAHFRRSFPAAVGACLLAMALLGIHQIRRRLRPLEELREGTQLVAEGRFDVSVEIDSGDEFEDLADSFNSMASRLGEHFATLESLSDIDRSMLSALSVPDIADVLLARFRELHPCRSLALCVFPSDATDPVKCFLSQEPSAPTRVCHVAGPNDTETRLLESRPESLRIELGAATPGFLEPLRAAGAEHAVLLPLFVKGALAGAIACESSGTEHAQERLTLARQAANQVAMALSNVRSIDENRALAYYDTLTGLPNRLLFKEHASQALAESLRHGRRVAICLLDLDGFKRVNDTLGHEMGDRLLRQVAQRVAGETRSGNLARLGGDEFTLLVREMQAAEDAARMGQRMLDAIAEPYEIDGREIFTAASLGIAVFPDDGTELDTLLRNADAAMYEAKGAGGNQYRFYTSALHRAALHRLDVEAGLHRALEREEFRLHYQPILDARSRKVVGAEALIRWQPADRPLQLPAEFIPVAEQSRLIEPIGEWAIRTACAQQRAWLREGVEVPYISVNVAARQIQAGNLVPTVQRALSDTGLPGRRLALEFTESSMMEGPDEVQKQLLRLKRIGVRVSIDDFGTGYSSLSYLKHFRVDSLKIDGCFIAGLPGNAEDASIVRAVIALADSLGLRVIAECVESRAQLAFLGEHGCGFVQGYLFSPALPADSFAKFVRDGEAGEA